MSNSLKLRFGINAAANAYSQVITIILQLALVPLFITRWNTDLYADWLVITGIPTTLILLELGVAQASTSQATMRAGAGKWIEAARSLYTSLTFTLCMSSLIVIVTLTANLLIDWKPLLNLRSIEGSAASVIIFLMSLNISIQMLGGCYEGWYRVADYAGLGTFLMASRRSVDCIVISTVLLFDGNALTLAISILSSQILMLIIIIIGGYSVTHSKIASPFSPSWSDFKKVFKPSIAYVMMTTSQVITIQGGIQFLNQIASPVIVIAFNMARTLTRVILQIGMVVNNSLKPVLSRLVGAGESKKAHDFTKKAARAAIYSSMAAYMMLVIFGPDFVQWWSNNQVTLTHALLAMLGIHAVLNVSWFVSAALQISTNRHVKLALIYAISSISSFTGWTLFSDSIDPFVGASLVLIAPEAIALIYHRLSRQNTLLLLN